MPAASVVLVAVVAAGMWVLPAGRWSQSLREVLAAALFAQNWQLAADAVDYAARSQATSVVQHFWSLAIQGQVFLLWPRAGGGGGAVVPAAAGAPARALTLVLLALGAASLALSIGLTADAQPLAYFHTLTRLWEFAARRAAGAAPGPGRARAAPAPGRRMDRCARAGRLRGGAAGGDRVPRRDRALAGRLRRARAGRPASPAAGSAWTGS